MTALPEEAASWPRWVVAVWVAFAEGRRYVEAAAAATVAAEAAGETGWCGLPVTAQHVWAFVRSRRPDAVVVKGLLGEGWKPLAEPAFDLLDKLVAEGSAESATPDAKARGLEAAKQILRITHPAGRQVAGGGNVQVNVSGDAAVSLGLSELLSGREPLRALSLVPSGGGEAAPEPVEATTVRKGRAASQRGEVERRRRRGG